MLKKYKWIFVASVLLAGVGFYYFFFLARTVAIVTLENKMAGNKYHDQIDVKFADGTSKRIRIPHIVWPFLAEGKEYFIVYHYNALRKPFLVRIENSG